MTNALLQAGNITDFPPGTGPRGHFFTAGRLRFPTSLGQATAGKEFTSHKTQWISDDFFQNHFYAAITNSYTGNDGVEADGSHSFTLVGASMQAFINGAWQVVTVISNAMANPITFAPGAGALIGPFTFNQWVPPETQMAIVLRVNTTTNAFVPTSIKLRSGSFESSKQTTQTSDFDLTALGALGGSDGRFGGELFSPAFIIAKPRGGLDRPVFWCDGDSIMWGKNSNEIALVTVGITYGSMGQTALAMDSKVNKKRYPFCISAIPGSSPSQVWTRRRELIRLCPNRPYTHIITNHLNNAGGTFQNFYDAIVTRCSEYKVESSFWRNGPCPVYHLGCPPKPGTSDWCTTSVNQTGSGQTYPTANRFQFEAALIAKSAGNIDGMITCDRIKEDTGNERDKWALTGFATTVASDFTSGGSSVILAASPPLGAMLVFDPGGSINGARHVTSISGTGPYTCGVDAVINSNMATGVVVKSTYVGDSGASGGTHPATPGHVLWSLDVAEWLAARFG